MDKEKCDCQKPDKLKGIPEDCAPEQIQDCHGEAKDHPCESEKKDDKQKK